MQIHLKAAQTRSQYKLTKSRSSFFTTKYPKKPNIILFCALILVSTTVFAISDKAVCSIYMKYWKGDGKITDCSVDNEHSIGSRWTRYDIKGKWEGVSILGNSGKWYYGHIEIKNDGSAFRDLE
jgi:hypothetical protein